MAPRRPRRSCLCAVLVGLACWKARLPPAPSGGRRRRYPSAGHLQTASAGPSKVEARTQHGRRAEEAAAARSQLPPRTPCRGPSGSASASPGRPCAQRPGRTHRSGRVARGRAAPACASRGTRGGSTRRRIADSQRRGREARAGPGACPSRVLSQREAGACPSEHTPSGRTAGGDWVSAEHGVPPPRCTAHPALVNRPGGS